MTPWHIEFLEEAEDDYDSLDGSALNQVDRAMYKVFQNPLPKNEGGYGEPLGNKRNRNLTGCYKIKLLKLGIRIVYELIRADGIMKIIVITARADEEVYDIAAERIKKNEQ